MTPITAPQTLPAAPVTRELALHLLNIQDRSPLAKLPIGAILKILSFLNPEDISAVSLSCRGLHAVSQDDHLWRSLFNSRFPTPLPTVMAKGACLKAYQKWHRVHPNLTNGVYALELLIEHKVYITSLLWVDGHLISGSWDHTIKIWDLNSRKCIRTLEGHTDHVTSLAWVHGNFVSGSDDKTIKIWDLNSGKCLRTLHGHTDAVNSVISADGVLISSSNSTIKIWDLNSGECIGTLEGTTSTHYALPNLLWANGMLFSGSEDTTIKIWDLTLRQCTRTLKGHSGRVTSLLWADGHLISGSWDHTIKIWDLNTDQCIKTLEGHKESVISLLWADGNLFSGSWDCMIKIWDLESGQCTRTLEGHRCWVSSLLWVDGNLISGSWDCMIGIWDFNASDEVMFGEIASLFRRKYPDNEISRIRARAMERFSRMPKKARDQIYDELNRILSPLAHDLENGKNAFHDLHGQSSTPDQKAQAIENYLNSVIKKSDFSTKRIRKV